MGIGEFEVYVKNCRSELCMMTKKKRSQGEKVLAVLKMFSQCTNSFEETTLLENLREEVTLCLMMS